MSDILARVANPSRFKSKQWVNIVAPDVGTTFPATGNAVLRRRGKAEEAITCPMVRGRARGQGTVIHVNANIEPGEWELVRVEATDWNFEFRSSPWVSDDWPALVPNLKARKGATIFESQPPTVEVNNYSNVLKIVHLRRQIPELMLTLDEWAYIYWDQDMVPFEMRLQYGNDSSEDMFLDVDEVWLESGEYLHLDYRHRKGLAEPEQIGQSGDLHWRTILLDADDTIGRSQQISHRGAILCVPVEQNLSQILSMGNADPTIASRFDSLKARMDAPIMGLSTWWPEGDWLGLGNTPQVPTESMADDGWQEANSRLALFIAELRGQGEIGDSRRLGLSKKPGSQGAQEDFANSGGSMCCTVGHPLTLFEMAFMVEGWSMRFIHHREQNGSVVRAANHPQTKMWNGRPHPAHSRHDMLGWPRDPGRWPHLGWHPMDDQHYSVNLLAAFQQLELSEGIDQDIDSLLEADLMSVPNRLGAPRSVGRRLLGWVNFKKTGTPAQKITAEALATELLENDILRDADLYNFTNDPTAEILVTKWKGAKYGWVTATGENQKGWNVWEEAMAACGAYAWWRVTGDERWRNYALKVARTVARWGCFLDGSTWNVCYAVRSVVDENGNHTGQPIPVSQYQVARNPNCFVSNSFWAWTIAAIQIVLEQAADPLITTNDVAKCRSIMDEIVGMEPATWKWAKWLVLAEI